MVKGDCTIAGARDGQKLRSLLGVKRKLGLEVPTLPESRSAPCNTEQAAESRLLEMLSVDDTCFAMVDGGCWYRARLLSVRPRSPRCYLEIVSTLDGRDHSQALPQKRKSHFHASCIRLDEPAPLPPTQTPAKHSTAVRRVARRKASTGGLDSPWLERGVEPQKELRVGPDQQAKRPASRTHARTYALLSSLSSRQPLPFTRTLVSSLPR